MRFEDIAQCELGTVLRQNISGRLAVLVAVDGLPLFTITVNYLDGDRELMVGCSPEKFERGILVAGAYLRECRSGRHAILVKDSCGPLTKIRFTDSKERETVNLCEQVRRGLQTRFEIAPPPSGTVAREKPL